VSDLLADALRLLAEHGRTDALGELVRIEFALFEAGDSRCGDVAAARRLLSLGRRQAAVELLDRLAPQGGKGG
jgi:hypothetical protein